MVKKRLKGLGIILSLAGGAALILLGLNLTITVPRFVYLLLGAGILFATFRFCRRCKVF